MQIHTPATVREGLKPQRGGLFIAPNTNRLFFLFFGGASAKRSSAKIQASNLGLRFEPIPASRRRKTKRKSNICVSCYEQATNRYLSEAALAAVLTNSPNGEYAWRLPALLPLLGGEGRGEGELFTN
jgi:hypothetical protein